MRVVQTALVFQWLARVTGTVQLVLGTIIWTTNADSLIPVHTTNGLLFLLSLWTLAGLGVRRVEAWRVALAATWGVIMVLLGLSQMNLLTGGLHWIVQVIHLGVGLTAIAQAEMLARSIRVVSRR